MSVMLAAKPRPVRLAEAFTFSGRFRQALKARAKLCSCAVNDVFADRLEKQRK
jgi:hypothetical protein